MSDLSARIASDRAEFFRIITRKSENKEKTALLGLVLPMQ